jgi:hypothetical protein
MNNIVINNNNNLILSYDINQKCIKTLFLLKNQGNFETFFILCLNKYK